MPLTRVTGNLIENGTIIDADISPSAAIAPSKLGAGTLPAGIMPAPVAGVKTVWLAPRTDGISGTGTELDPYDVGGTTQQIAANKYDAVISDRTKCPEQCTIRLHQGNYFTNGTQYYNQYSPQGPSRTYRVWYPADCSVIGSGMNNTKLTWINPNLVDNNSKGAPIQIAGNPSRTDQLCIISDITVDCNWQNLKPTTNPALLPGYPNECGRILAQQGAKIDSVDYSLIERVAVINIGGDWTNGWESFAIGSTGRKTAIVRHCIVKNMIEGWDNSQPYVSAVGCAVELQQIPLYDPNLVGYTYAQKEGMSIIEDCIVLGGSTNHAYTGFCFSPSRIVRGNYCDKVVYGMHVDTGYGWQSNIINNFFGDVLVAISFNFIQDKWSNPLLPFGASYLEYANIENNIISMYERSPGYNRLWRISGNSLNVKFNNNYIRDTDSIYKGITNISYSSSLNRVTITTRTPHNFSSGESCLFRGVKVAPSGQPNNGNLRNPINHFGASNITVTSSTVFYYTLDSYITSVLFPDFATSTFALDGNSLCLQRNMNAEFVYTRTLEVRDNLVGLSMGSLVLEENGSIKAENNINYFDRMQKYDFAEQYCKTMFVNREFRDSPYQFNLVCTSVAPFVVTATSVFQRNLDIWGWDNGIKVKIESSSVPAYNGTYVIKNLNVPNGSPSTATFQFDVSSALPAANYATATPLLADLARGRDFLAAWNSADEGKVINVSGGTYDLDYFRSFFGVFPYLYRAITIVGTANSPDECVLILNNDFLRINTLDKSFKAYNIKFYGVGLTPSILLSSNPVSEYYNCIFDATDPIFGRAIGKFKDCKFNKQFAVTGGYFGAMCGEFENCNFLVYPSSAGQYGPPSESPTNKLINCRGDAKNSVNIATPTTIENCIFNNSASNNTQVYCQNKLDMFNCLIDGGRITVVTNQPVRVYNTQINVKVAATDNAIMTEPTGTARTITIGNCETNATTPKGPNVTVVASNRII